MINLREITGKNLKSIIDLNVKEGQKDCVASNSVSIAQGHYAKSAWFKGIFNDDLPVGFVMLDLIKEENKCFLWRFMIDEKHQGKGYGKLALNQVIDWVRSLEAFEEIRTSYVPTKNSADGFYEKFGFIETGKLEDSNEIGMEYSLLKKL